jgi:hypothetical protein
MVSRRYSLLAVRPNNQPFDDSTFPPNFAIAPAGLPSGAPRRVFYYPGANTRGGRDGLIVAVAPIDQERWTGVFARGDLSGAPDEASRRVVTLPGGERFFVACDGAGYIVRAEDPVDWSDVACLPVRIVCVVPSHQLLVLGDFTDLVAYGRQGLAWQSGRLVWDELSIVAVHDDHLVARGWHAPTNRTVEFEVDLATGEAIGPPHA